MTAGRVTIEDGVVFGTGGGRDLHCDVFRPPADVLGDGPAPGVLLVHGGGWRSGDRTQLRGYGILLARAGYVCVAGEYRLVPESPWPAQIHDVKAALRWMRANADDLGLDPGRIVVEGNSAGGHLALLAAGTEGVEEFEGNGGHAGVSSAVAAVIAVYPPTLLHHREPGRGSLPLVVLSEDGTHDVARSASPLTYVGPGFPPTLLIHGGADELVPVAATEIMYEALMAAGVPVELHLFANQPHGFDAEPRFGRRCADEMLFFLDRFVRVAAPA